MLNKFILRFNLPLSSSNRSLTVATHFDFIGNAIINNYFFHVYKIIHKLINISFQIVNLSLEGISDSDISDIIEACQGFQNQIKELWLGSNNISAEGAKYLSATNFPKLTKLNLYDNNIGAKGAKYLSAANFSNLTMLILRSNNIRAEGVKYLQAANFPNLTMLTLQFNNIKQPNSTYLMLLFKQKNIKNVYL